MLLYTLSSFYYFLSSLQVLTFVLILILRFAGSGHTNFGFNIDGMFFGIGTSVGYCIIVTLTIIANAIGDKMSLLEVASNALAVLLFFAVGITGVATGTGHLIAVGIISLLTSVVFLVDLLVIVRNMKVSSLQQN